MKFHEKRKRMKRTHYLVFAILLGLTIILSACVPGPRVTGTPGIDLSEEMVYVAYGNFVYGLNPENGSVTWNFPDEASNQVVFFAPPIYSEGNIYVGDLANNFHKLDAENGEAEWTFTEAKGFFMGQAAVEDGMVYAPSNDGNLYALNENGNLLWTFETGHYIWAQPQISSNAVFIGSMDHSAYAVTKDGEEIWSQELSGAIIGSPVLSEDEAVLFVGSIGKEMVALDTSNGEIIWTFNAGGDLESVWGKAILVDGLLIFVDSTGQVFALDAETGDPEWQTDFSENVVGGLEAISDGFVLATEQGSIKAFDLDGSPLWEATLGGESFREPVTNGEYLAVGLIDGENLIYSLNMSGVQLWSTTPEN